jgi:hypothetical protein
MSRDALSYGYGYDIGAGRDRTVISVMNYRDGNWITKHAGLDPSSSKIKRIWRRVRQLNRKLARKALEK